MLLSENLYTYPYPLPKNSSDLGHLKTGTWSWLGGSGPLDPPASYAPGRGPGGREVEERGISPTQVDPNGLAGSLLLYVQAYMQSINILGCLPSFSLFFFLFCFLFSLWAPSGS